MRRISLFFKLHEGIVVPYFTFFLNKKYVFMDTYIDKENMTEHLQLLNLGG